MKLYIEIKKMIFDEDNIEHEIILKVSDEESYGYDVKLELPDDDKFIKDTLKIFYKKGDKGKDTKEIDYKEFVIREQQTWNSFPLYEIIDGKIVSFDYTKYAYFANTDRRIALAFKINDLYNPSSEAKIIRKALKILFDESNTECLEFQKYYSKIEDIINRNPK